MTDPIQWTARHAFLPDDGDEPRCQYVLENNGARRVWCNQLSDDPVHARIDHTQAIIALDREVRLKGLTVTNARDLAYQYVETIRARLQTIEAMLRGKKAYDANVLNVIQDDVRTAINNLPVPMKQLEETQQQQIMLCGAIETLRRSESP